MSEETQTEGTSPELDEFGLKVNPRIAELAVELVKPVDPAFVSKRQGLSYVTGRYVKAKLNELFGWDGWDFIIINFKHATPEAPRAHCQGRLRVTVRGTHITRDGVAQGYGTIKDDTSQDRINQVLDFADAEAITDCLKRCAVSLGEQLGLSLYPLTPGNFGPKLKGTKKSSASKDGAPTTRRRVVRKRKA